MDRRNFLQAINGILTIPILARSEEENKINLGFSLYGMKSLPLKEAIDICAEIGYTHVELALLDGFPSAPSVFTTEARKAVSRQLSDLQLELPSLMISISLIGNDRSHSDSLELIARAGEWASQLKPARPPILETILGGRPSAWDQQRNEMADKLSSWAKAAEMAGTQIAIKAHVSSAVNTPERLLWLLQQVKSSAIVVAYDYSHFELQSIDMEESMAALLPFTRFIHVKDSQGKPGKFQFLLPGEGRIDYVKYFSLLKKYGYFGPVCAEVSGQISGKPDYNPEVAARACYSTLSSALQRSISE